MRDMAFENVWLNQLRTGTWNEIAGQDPTFDNIFISLQEEIRKRSGTWQFGSWEDRMIVFEMVDESAIRICNLANNYR